MGGGVIVFKSEFSNDIRRFSLDEKSKFGVLESTISRLYSLTIGHFSISTISGDIFSESNFHQLMQDAKQKNSGSVRVIINKINPKVEEISSTKQTLIPEKETVEEKKIDGPLLIDQIFQQIEFQQQLQSIIEETITSKPVMDLVIQQVTPRVIELVEESVSKSLIKEHLRKPLQETPISTTSTVSSIQSEENKVDASTETNESNNLSTSSLIESLIMEKIPQAINTTTNDISKAFESIFQEKKDQKSQEILKEKEAPKRIISTEESDNVEQNQDDNSPFRTVFSFFKALKDKPPKPETKNELPPVDEELEEAMKELNLMGFTDREANLRALRFHKNFNEGLDEVIEDLLNQESLQTKEKLVQENQEKDIDQIVD